MQAGDFVRTLRVRRCVFLAAFGLLACTGSGDDDGRDSSTGDAASEGGAMTSCSDVTAGWLAQVEGVLEERSACIDDDDCAFLDADVNCSETLYVRVCGVGVGVVDLAAAETEIDRLRETFCDEVATSCTSGSSCPSGLAPHCRAGTCRHD